MKALIVILTAAALSTSLHADEGYYLFTDPPTAVISDKYHVTLDADWLKHLSGAAVKIGGGSGSFVSADGLVITNRHVGAGQLHTLSTRQHDYEKDGFYAANLRDELPCRGLELLVLQHTENVTARVMAAVKPGASPEEADAAHKAIEAAIEKESFDRTGLTSEVITLYGGARYDLYQYKKYPDVRLVFAPDHDMAAFGGDPDNFEFPRYDLDICLFRIYDHGQPLRTSDPLKWNAAGPAKDELVFVAGHPGYSQRLSTLDDLAFQRDFKLPRTVEEFDRFESALNAFADTSPEHRRQAGEALASVANGRKAYHGFLTGLREPGLLNEHPYDETALKTMLANRPIQDASAALKAFDEISQAIKADRANYQAYQNYERFAGRSDLFNMARTLVRAAAERAKPNGERLPAYRESELPSLEFRLFSGRPYYPDLEIFFLTDGLDQLVKQFGADDPLVKKLLAGKSPRERAGELVKGTKLEEISFRRQTYFSIQSPKLRSADPLLEFAAIMDPAARAARKMDDQDDLIKHRAYATIYTALVKYNMAPPYPDATGTLRLAFGTVTGFEQDGHFVEPFTTFGGMYQHAEEHAHRPPYAIPATWAQDTAKLNPATPLNFASTADILGGNSGSPVVNRAGEFVGIIFDSNRYGFGGRYAYDAKLNRSVAVDSAGITEALRKVYHADALVKELESGHHQPTP